MFNLPNQLNGLQLRSELRAAGIKISDNKESVKVSDNVLILEIDPKDRDKALTIIESHVGIEQNLINPEKEALLAKLGITDDEAKLLLS